jgi:membrane fusion protein, multidrug efflux system
MKLTVYILVLATAIILSCSTDNRTTLAKLKEQRATIDEKIRILEEEMTEKRDSLDPAKFRLVGISEIEPGIFNHYIKVQGKLDGEQNTTVYADVAGTIREKYADVGQKVRKGQVLAQVDDQQYRLQLENLRTQYRFAADMYEKQKKLWEQKIGSEVQFLQSQTTRESLEQQISVLEEQLEKFKIKSPIDGTVEESNIRPGSVVSPNPMAAIYRVVGFRQLKVTAEVSESYASNIKEGDKVLIHFPDLKTRIESSVDFVSSYVDPVNRTFMVECKVPESLPGMKANMIAVISINDYHSEESIQLPMNVIMKDLKGSYVYVVRDKDDHQGAFRQPVSIGRTYNGIAEITNGLENNDRVITTGYNELIDGEYVRFEEPGSNFMGGK